MTGTERQSELIGLIGAELIELDRARARALTAEKRIADWREEWDAIALDQRMTKYHDVQAEVR